MGTQVKSPLKVLRRRIPGRNLARLLFTPFGFRFVIAAVLMTADHLAQLRSLAACFSCG